MLPVSQIYALPGWAEDPKGICLPDAVIKPLLDALLPVTKTLFEKHVDLEKKGLAPELNRHRILIKTPQLSWDQCGNLAVASIEAAVPFLGERARGVLEAKKRWKRVEAEPGDGWGRCHYPGDAKKEKAWIEFGADGTIGDAIYIAHELGHLLAGDLSQERKLTGDDYFPRKHLGEVQAFFLQHVLYGYLMREPRAAFLRDEAQRHFIAEITRGAYYCVLSVAALEAFRQGEKGAPEAAIKKQCMEFLQKMLGPMWESFAPAAKLAASGAEDLLLLQNTVWNIHAHSAAAIIGAGLYDRFMAAKPDQKDKMIEALYCGGRKHTILDVFAALDIDDGKIGSFMSDSVWAGAEPLQLLHAQSRTRRKTESAV